MVEFDKPTIPITAGDAGTHVNSWRTAGQFWRALRYAGAALLVIVATVWGIWRFAGTTTRGVNDESIGDLDGFEFASPQLNASSDQHPAAGQLGEMTSLAPPCDALRSPDAGFLSSAPTIPVEESASVWLNGTIEDVEPVERIQMPIRFSDRPDGSVILR